MVKRVLAIMFMASVLLTLTVTCAPNQYVSVAVIDALKQTTDSGIARIDSDLERTYQQLDDVEEKLLKLDQVLKPCLQWIDSFLL